MKIDHATAEGFKRPWPPLIKTDAAVKAKMKALFGNDSDKARTTH